VIRAQRHQLFFFEVDDNAPNAVLDINLRVVEEERLAPANQHWAGNYCASPRPKAKALASLMYVAVTRSTGMEASRRLR
jgi:hypothetical protein